MVFAVAACAVLTGYNNLVGLRPWHRRWYPAVNALAAAAALAAEALAANRLAAGRGARVAAVGAVVAGTAAAGALLSCLRERSGSLAAPVMLHLAANCAGPLASALARPTGGWPRSGPGCR